MRERNSEDNGYSVGSFENEDDDDEERTMMPVDNPQGNARKRRKQSELVNSSWPAAAARVLTAVE